MLELYNIKEENIYTINKKKKKQFHRIVSYFFFNT